MTEPPAVELQGTTSTSLPYPESTAPLNQGANDIKALALALTAQLPIKRVVFLTGTYTANASSIATVNTGLTTINGAVVTSQSTEQVLLMVAGPLPVAGPNLSIKVYVNGSGWANNGFACSILAWGS